MRFLIFFFENISQKWLPRFYTYAFVVPFNIYNMAQDELATFSGRTVFFNKKK